MSAREPLELSRPADARGPDDPPVEPVETGEHQPGRLPEPRVRWARPWMGAVLASMRLQPNQAEAARAAGISRETVRWWLHRDPLFAAAYTEAREVGLDLMERRAHEWAMVGVERVETRVKTYRAPGPNGEMVDMTETTTTTAREMSPQILALLLRAYRPERFRERHEVRHTGADGGPVQHEVVSAEAARPRDASRLRELGAALQQIEMPALEAGHPDVEGEASRNGGSADAPA